jgi:hypothetical protein
MLSLLIALFSQIVALNNQVCFLSESNNKILSFYLYLIVKADINNQKVCKLKTF